jgi:hypothetical protein
MNIIDEIQAIAARESADPSNERLRWRIREAVSKLPDAISADRQTSRWFEYEVDVCDQRPADDEAEILTWLRSLDIGAAPEVAAIIPIRGQECVLVRRYWACPGERLLVPHPLDGSSWPEAARVRFLRDMEHLTEHGKVHPWARGYAHMYVSERSGTILLNTWSMLKSGTPDEQHDFLHSIKFKLLRRTAGEDR